MPASTTVMGMVISAMPVGDYDKRLVILTKELGKISAFAKGARRPNSAFLACSEPFSFGEFTLYAGRSSYNIISVEISNYFTELRSDIDCLYYSFYFCEFTDYITKEGNDEKEILKLLYQTLKAVAKKTIGFRLIRAVYELKLMALNGQAPQLFECVKCGRESDSYRFSSENGGVLCSACKFQDTDAISISTSALYAMQYIISKEIEKLYTFIVTEEVLIELEVCIKKYLEHYIDHKFKSLKIIMEL